MKIISQPDYLFVGKCPGCNAVIETEEGDKISVGMVLNMVLFRVVECPICGQDINVTHKANEES